MKKMDSMLEAWQRYLDKAFVIARHLSWKDLHSYMERLFQQQGFRSNAHDTVETLLVISLNQTGDNVLMSAFLRELRRNKPQAYIVMVLSPYLQNLMELCPYVNRIVTVKMGGGTDVRGCLERVGDLCYQELWPIHFDAAIIPQWGDDKLEHRLIAFLSGARNRYNFSDASQALYWGLEMEPSEFECLYMTHNFVSPVEVVHELQRMLYLLKAMGMEIHNDSAEIWLSSADRLQARLMLASLKEKESDRCLIAIGIGASGKGRCYPVEQYLEVMRALLLDGCDFVVLGGSGEKSEGEYLLKNMPAGRLLNLAGVTSMRETGALLEEADIYLGNDTGVMHMAAALHKPVVAVFREAAIGEDPEKKPGIFSEYCRFKPWQTDSICLRPDRPLDDCAEIPSYGWCRYGEAHCIKQVKVADVVEAVRKFIRS